MVSPVAILIKYNNVMMALGLQDMQAVETGFEKFFGTIVSLQKKNQYAVTTLSIA